MIAPDTESETADDVGRLLQSWSPIEQAPRIGVVIDGDVYSPSEADPELVESYSALREHDDLVASVGTTALRPVCETHRCAALDREPNQNEFCLLPPSTLK